MKQRLLVLGGSGFVGRALCERIARQHPDWTLVVPTRRAAAAAVVQTLPQVQVQVTPVLDDAALAALVSGCDAVVNLVAQLHGSEASFEQLHVALPQRLGAACQAQGVQRLIHVSALGVDVQAPSRYLRSKARGEAVVREAGLAATVLRPSVIYGAGDAFLNLFARLQAVAPVVPLAGASARFQPVWVDDVAAAIVACLGRPSTAGQLYELAGPEIWTLADLVRLSGRLSGHPRPVVALPGALAWLQALAMEALPGQPLMSRDNLASMQVPNVATGQHPGLAELGIAAQALRAVAPTYLRAQVRCARLDGWRARHR